MKSLIVNKDIKYINGAFIGSLETIPFQTEYIVKNSITSAERTFIFDHSTGSEWDPSTQWIYKTSDKLTLKLQNHVETGAAEAYLKAKTR